jgi:hypothetical protein
MYSVRLAVLALCSVIPWTVQVASQVSQAESRPLSICDVQDSIAKLRKKGSEAHQAPIWLEAVFLWIPPHGYTLKDSRCPEVSLDPVFVVGDPSVAEFERAYPTFHPSYATDPGLWGPGSTFVVVFSGTFTWSSRENQNGLMAVERVDSVRRIPSSAFIQTLERSAATQKNQTPVLGSDEPRLVVDPPNSLFLVSNGRRTLIKQLADGQEFQGTAILDSWTLFVAHSMLEGGASTRLYLYRIPERRWESLGELGATGGSEFVYSKANGARLQRRALSRSTSRRASEAASSASCVGFSTRPMSFQSLWWVVSRTRQNRAGDSSTDSGRGWSFRA